MQNQPNISRLADVLGEILSDKHGVDVSITMTPKEPDADTSTEAIA